MDLGGGYVSLSGESFHFIFGQKQLNSHTHFYDFMAIPWYTACFKPRHVSFMAAHSPRAALFIAS